MFPNRNVSRRGWLTLLLLIPSLCGCRLPAAGSAPAPASKAADTANGRLAAPGVLEPSGGTFTLAAPVGPLGVTPRVERLYVKTGERVRVGQRLARFDSYEGLSREIDEVDARIQGLNDEISILQRQTQRFANLSSQGVLAKSDFEDRSLRLTQLKNNLQVAKQERRVLEERLRQAQLVAPISGEVLSVHAKPGEQPRLDGVLQLGAGEELVVKAQVEEASMNLVFVGQKVDVIGENATFPRPLTGRVITIAPQVSPRRALNLRPGYYRDNEPRVVDVTIALEPGERSTGDYTRSGSKVQALFRPAAGSNPQARR